MQFIKQCSAINALHFLRELPSSFRLKKRQILLVQTGCVLVLWTMAVKTRVLLQLEEFIVKSPINYEIVELEYTKACPVYSRLESKISCLG